MSQKQCYHCGLPVPVELNLSVTINGESHPMCCPGCQAVAQAIVDAGLTDFYKYRTENAPTGRALVPEFLEQTQIYDNPAVQKRFVRYENEQVREAALILEGITCAACIWLNEQHLRRLTGVIEVQMNYSTQRARVRWDNSQIKLSDILQAISQIGYLAHPYDPARQQEILEREKKQQLRRLGITGVLGMQIMMFSVALYAGDWYGMAPAFRELFYWVNLLLTLPIMLYSAEPFFRSAWRDLSHRQVGMEVPVTLGISLAFIGSVWTTLTHSSAHVYYDSIAMFVFFLLTARHFELVARQRSTQAAEKLVHLVPTLATRLRQTASGFIEESVLVAELAIGDRLLIRPGETIPADGLILQGESTIDESLLTGESDPQLKQPGANVIGGTINRENPLQIQVDKIGADTVLSHILRLLERAQTEKPVITQLADRVAAWFILGVLILAMAVAIYWWQVNPEAWLAITLSVLVVTCPCALSLATPTAITAATSALTRIGLLTTRGHALETLARATHFVFDKTGTLTTGQLQLITTHPFAQLDHQQCLHYAVALERYSEHPIAQALIAAHEKQGKNTDISLANNVKNYPGAGISGEINQQLFFLGTPSFIEQQTQAQLPSLQALETEMPGKTWVLLADQQTVYSAFVLGDQLRPGAKSLIQALQQQGKQVSLYSGDQANVVEHIAQAVGIEDIGYAMKPAEKLQQVQALQAQGAIVAMIGDGINDAPVLAQAQVSIAMGSGTQIARASADMILLTEQLPNLLTGISTARKTLQIIRQNMIWAIGYNLLALPAAAMGLVAPWLAAIGMSLSSLLVVINALRLINPR